MITFAEITTSTEIGLIYAIAAIGVYLTLRVIDFPDLTCDGSFACGAVVSAVALKYDFQPLVALALGAVMGGVAGFCTGIFHNYFSINPLLSGILVAFMLYSVNLRIMSGAPNIVLFNNATVFTSFYFSPLLILLTVVGVISFVTAYILHTDIGLALRLIGQNKILASVMGIRVTVYTLLGLIISNALLGLSGALFSQYQGFADISQGIGTLVVGLVGVIIGEKIISTRMMWLSVVSCVMGSVLYRYIIACALHTDFLGIQTSDLNFITGAIVVLFMLMPKLSIKGLFNA